MAQSTDVAVKRSVVRVLGLNIVTSGLYMFYWFYVTRQQVTEVVKGNDQVGLQTAGLLVPILQAFIVYWLYRDINKLRESAKLSSFPAGLYVWLPYALIAAAVVILVLSAISAAGGVASLDNDTNAAGGLFGASILGGLLALLVILAAAVLQLVFFGLVVSKLNEYWDKKISGATDAKFGGGEIAIIVVGVLLFAANACTPRGGSNDDDIDKFLEDVRKENSDTFNY